MQDSDCAADEQGAVDVPVCGLHLWLQHHKGEDRAAAESQTRGHLPHSTEHHDGGNPGHQRGHSRKGHPPRYRLPPAHGSKLGGQPLPQLDLSVGTLSHWLSLCETVHVLELLELVFPGSFYSA